MLLRARPLHPPLRLSSLFAVVVGVPEHKREWVGELIRVEHLELVEVVDEAVSV